MDVLNKYIENTLQSLGPFFSEFILIAGIVFLLIAGLIKNKTAVSAVITVLTLLSSFVFVLIDFVGHEQYFLFGGMISSGDFSNYFKFLFLTAGLLTVFLSLRDQNPFRSEYYILIIAIILGAHLLVMSRNFVMAFISLELISISSYVLAGFSFTKKGAEGSLKYFLFGSVASAIMVYGFSILYGLTGTLDFNYGDQLTERLSSVQSPLFLIASLMVLGGFLFKIVAVPMHVWSPDVYEAAPVPVIAFFSVVPKLAGIGILCHFISLIRSIDNDAHDWRLILAAISFLTMTVGNFAALLQKNPKRMMAYSSIAQSGFLLAGVTSFLPESASFVLFYSTVYLLMNFLVFLYIQYFERFEIVSMEGFSGVGKIAVWPSVFCLVGLIALTGLPPTSGFTGKLFIFSSLWQAYELTSQPFLLALMIFGLLNTVVSLFFYLKIPYYAFLKAGEPLKKQNNLTFENLLGLILVLMLLVLFFQPGLLMGWINKITFVN